MVWWISLCRNQTGKLSIFVLSSTAFVVRYNFWEKRRKVLTSKCSAFSISSIFAFTTGNWLEDKAIKKWVNKWIKNDKKRVLSYLLPPSTHHTPPPPDFSPTKCERKGSEVNKRHAANLHKLARVPCCMTWRYKIWILNRLRLPTLLNNIISQQQKLQHLQQIRN